MWLIQRPKNGKKFPCNFARNFAIAYPGKAVTQSKVPNSSNIEDMHDKLASIDAAGWNEENTLEIKGFLKNRFTKISYGCPIAILKKSV